MQRIQAFHELIELRAFALSSWFNERVQWLTLLLAGINKHKRIRHKLRMNIQKVHMPKKMLRGKGANTTGMTGGGGEEAEDALIWEGREAACG
jgi:hypothetical protein